MKKALKLFLAVQIVSISILAFPYQVNADGSIYMYRSDLEWEKASEGEQIAYINYEDGIEKLLLSVKTEQINGSKLVWFVPVPSNPNNVKVDILDELPYLQGNSISRAGGDIAAANILIATLSQVYTIPFCAVPLFFISGGKITPMYTDSNLVGGNTSKDLITVYQEINKYGITTELIGTKSKEALREYLEKKGFKVNESNNKILSDYVDKDYSYVVSWITDTNTLRSKKSDSLGIEIDFPTDDMYYPLIPTSVYGENKVPATIYVIGFVSPKIFKEISQGTSVSYFYDREYYFPIKFSRFFGNKKNIKDLKVTKIDIDTEAKNYTSDLWINKRTPLKVLILYFLYKYYILVSIIQFIVISCISSFLSALIVFRKEKYSKLKFFFWGLWNILTLIGLTIATIFLKTKTYDKNVLESVKGQGIIFWDKRKILYIALFSFTSILLNVLVDFFWIIL